MENTLKTYYSRTELSQVYGDAMILNPRCKLAIFEEESWEDEDPEKYISACRRRFFEGYANSENPPYVSAAEQSRTPFSENVDSEFLELLNKRSAKRRSDFDRYIDIPNDANIASSLVWWKNNKDLYPQLANMARDVLAVPASGCTVEREFSISGRIAIWQRNRLSPSTISDSMIYKSGLKRKRLALQMNGDEDDLVVPEMCG